MPPSRSRVDKAVEEKETVTSLQRATPEAKARVPLAMAAAKGGTKKYSSLFLVLFLSLILVIPVRADHGGHVGGVGSEGIRSEEANEEKKEAKGTVPDVVERAIGVTGFMNRLDSIRTWAELALMKIKPPDYSYFRGKSSPGQVMKEAASRSFESSKETVEHAAKSAAKVAEEAVHMTKEKVKRTVSSDGEYADAEL